MGYEIQPFVKGAKYPWRGKVGLFQRRGGKFAGKRLLRQPPRPIDPDLQEAALAAELEKEAQRQFSAWDKRAR
jgi:hypothetical protein